MVLTLLRLLRTADNRLPKALPNQEEGEPDGISIGRSWLSELSLKGILIV
jgi:hypothetical protein